MTPPNCPKCGDNRQVWANQITGRMTCHRIDCHTEIETMRKQTEAHRIADKTWRKAAAERAARIQAEDAQRQADRDAEMQAATAMIKTWAPAAPVSPAIPSDTGARLTLGQINERLSPVSISVAGLRELGFAPVEQVKAAQLYRESDSPAICAAIVQHVTEAARALPA